MNDDELPATRAEIAEQQNTAANLVRTKLSKLYGTEPDAAEEIAEIETLTNSHMSKHQRHMQSLTSSKRSLAEIQAAWHEYYAGLSDKEKHEVWQEFYAQHEQAKTHPTITPQTKPEPVAVHQPEEPKATTPHHAAAIKPVYGQNHQTSRRTGRPSKARDVKKQLLAKVQKRGKITKNHHVRSLFFGISMGLLSVFILLFSFFNERFIVPFIRPSHNVSASPIIVDPTSSGVIGPESKIIIPKINVEAPVVYDEPSIADKPIQRALERGVVHYATTPNPGEKGNAVIFGHSSSNILNKGKYKFAFILLKSLDVNDTFIIQKDGKRYVYKVYRKFVTSPIDTSVLGAADKPSTMTLITCDPPGTSTHRLIVIGEQIFPEPGANKASTAKGDPTTVKEIPSNAPTLWQRIKGWF